MQEQTPPSGDLSKEGTEPTTSIKEGSLFSETTGGVSGARAPAAPSKAASPGKTFQRVILPVAIFVGAIAVIAWVSQYLPSIRRTREKQAPVKTVVRFFKPEPGKDTENPSLTLQPVQARSASIEALWDVAEPEYELEIEKTDSGKYDFLFINESNENAEVGLAFSNCVCTEVRICILPPERAKAHVRSQHAQSPGNSPSVSRKESGYEWKTMEVDQSEGVIVPAGQGGLVRLAFEGSKMRSAHDNISANIWSQSKGAPVSDRNVIELVAKITRVPPVGYYPGTIDFGTLLPGQELEQHFWYWSATRDSFQLKFPENDTNPCLQCSKMRLNEKEMQELQSLLSDALGRPTKVKCAYKVTVRVTEQKDGKRLDMGVLNDHIPVSAALDGRVEPIASPMYRVNIPSDVKVVGAKNATIALKTFPSSQGVKEKKSTLRSKKGVELKIDKVQPSIIGATLNKLKTVGDETYWEIRITILGGLHSGSLENSYVQLSSTRPGEDPRLIRIAVTGTAVRSKDSDF